MLTEVKVKASRAGNAGKLVKRQETYLVDCEFYAEAENAVASKLAHDGCEDYEITSMRRSPVKEIAFQFEGDYAYVAILKDTFVDDKGDEKHMRYQVLLWANNLREATANALKMQKEGYDMAVESLKEVNWEIIGLSGEDLS